MDTNLQLLKQFYCELNVPQDVVSIDQRLVLQKVALLGQSVGVSLDYTYNWYVKGPYSPSLTEDYFKLQGYVDKPSQFKFNQAVKEKLNSLSEVIHKHDVDGKILPKWVEALASIVFLIKKTHKTEDEAIAVLFSQKSHIDEDMRNDAIRNLKKINLI
ncbi:hypothetical protein [Thiomicrorhabdus arctica]|uniref:hypothetical protein n=1 Tax=Thiomicrorhabdus arctica TaxID=131540 RepID=UPI000374D473|nr:hypothetical protein [Thiomicrorhabdus arctica]